MSETAFDVPLKDDNTMASTNNKRKRTSLDTPAARPAPGFSRSGANNDLDSAHNPDEGALHLTEADYNAIEHGGDQHGHSNGSNVGRDATDTAASALAAFNGFTVP